MSKFKDTMKGLFTPKTTLGKISLAVFVIVVVAFAIKIIGG